MGEKIMTDNVMNIVMCSSNEYSIHCGTLIISILKNSLADEKFNFYIIEANMSEENKNTLSQLKKIKPFNINFIKIDGEIFNDEAFTKEYSYMPQLRVQTFYKYLIPNLLKDIDKVLYLDIDTLVFNSLADFYNIDLTGKYAAVIENNDRYTAINKIGVKNYFNAGVILYNLKKCREDNISEKLFKNHITLFKQGKLKYADQCVLNYTFNENVVWADLKYNVGTQWTHNKSKACKTAVANAIIAHFTTPQKPWNFVLTHPYAKEYFKYLPFSTFKEAKELQKSYRKYLIKRYTHGLKAVFDFVKSYFLFPWYVYKTYKLVKSKE